jgi:hypothetical protein
MRLWIAMVVTAAVAFAAAVAGIGVRASYGARVTGDEPQYLITAISIGTDGNLNVSDEIAGRAYDSFHEVDLDPQTVPLAGGREVSPHDPLLPALLALPMLVGGWAAAKVTLALMAALLAALLVWISAVRFEVPESRAALVVGILAASAPLAVYGGQVYPEIPAALAVGVAIACLTGRLGAGGLLGVGASVVALPWLSVKYTPVALAVAVLALWSLWREGRTRAAAGLFLAWVVAAAGFLVGHLSWYGGVTPYATGDHFAATGEFGVLGSNPNYAGRSVRLIGLLVDNRFGLAAWQPAWLVTMAALAALLRARSRGWAPLAVPLVAGWLSATYLALTMQGWWWPGRQVVVVLPCAVIALAWWAGRSRRRTAIIGCLGGLGLLTYVWVVAEGLGGGLTWAVDFYETANPWYRAWSGLLPDYLDPTGLTWVLHGAWIAAASAIAVSGWISSRIRTETNYRSPSRSPIPSMIPSRSRP